MEWNKKGNTWVAKPQAKYTFFALYEASDVIFILKIGKLFLLFTIFKHIRLFALWRHTLSHMMIYMFVNNVILKWRCIMYMSS